MYFCAKYFLVFDFGLILLKHMFLIFFLIKLKYDFLFVDYHQYSSLLRLKLFRLFDYSIVFYFGATYFPLLYIYICIVLDIIHFLLHFFFGYSPFFIFKFFLFSILFYLWEHYSF